MLRSIDYARCTQLHHLSRGRCIVTIGHSVFGLSLSAHCSPPPAPSFRPQLSGSAGKHIRMAMEPIKQSSEVEEVYSVWALTPEPARGRLCRLMAGLRAAHGGPTFELHVTVVGAIRLRRSVAIRLSMPQLQASARTRPASSAAVGGSTATAASCSSPPRRSVRS
jgi:hypothetical protein